MKLNRHSLRMLIESVLQEEVDVSKFKKGESTIVATKGAAADNKAAFEVSDVDTIKKKLGIKISGKYYVWKGSQAEAGYKLGSVRYSSGDPYTYEELSNGFYRVMSGPDSNEKRDSGKRIGTSPIGAKFKPSSPPDVVVDPTNVLSKLRETPDGDKRSGNFDKAVNILVACASDKKQLGDVISELESLASRPIRGKDLLAHPAHYVARLMMGGVQQGGEVSGTGAAASNSKIINKYLSLLQKKHGMGRGNVDIKFDMRISQDRADKSNFGDSVKSGAKTGGGQAEKMDESLSRGSLLRRRYRRY